MGERISLTVNGRLYTVELEGWEKLLDILREHLNLTGSKRGCDDATCAACTVLLNGEAVKACVTAAKKCAGGEVLTIEGLAREGELHPIQQALITSGAVQCGYCTPGIVMELYALYKRSPDAGEEEIRKALNKHLCRCTGYEAIWEGALAAQKALQADRKT
jgi:carbon-monoxide dehydrogenase small subunit